MEKEIVEVVPPAQMNVIMVDSPDRLVEAIREMADSNEMAIDLEFDKNRFRYGFNLCLLQIATGRKCFIIDPLARDVDVTAVFPLLEDPGIQKVVFAFGEDLRLLHSLGCWPKGLFDLRTAASLLNYPPSSLTNLIKEILSVDLVHSAQNSNWYKRPLTGVQIEYAADDVRYLFELRNQIMKEGGKLGVLPFFSEENQFIDELNLKDAENNVLFRTKDKFGHSQYSWFVFEQLLRFREKLAEQLNRPSYQVINKEYLLELSKDQRAIRKWSSVNGIHRLAKTEKYRKLLAAVVAAAFSAADKARLSKTEPAIPKPDPDEVRRNRAEKAEMERIKREVFDPIKQKMIEDFGEHAATFMLSNRAVMDLIGGDQSVLRPYKRKLLREYASAVGVDVEAYLQ